MSLKVTPRARSHADRAGDPLDGLVNLFDLGIVLSVAFLLAALSSADLSDVLTDAGQDIASQNQVTVPLDQAKPLPEQGKQVEGRGTEVGTVFKLADGRTVYVPNGNSPPSSSPP
jgi:hypothetical protein